MRNIKGMIGFDKQTFFICAKQSCRNSLKGDKNLSAENKNVIASPFGKVGNFAFALA